MEKRGCPHGWNNCKDCKHYQLCKLGVYVPLENEEEHRETVRKAAEIAGEAVHEEAVRSAKILSLPGDLIQAESEEFWRFWGATSPPDPETRQREPIVAMGGAIERGGGSKSGKKRKKPKKASDWRPYMINF